MNARLSFEPDPPTPPFVKLRHLLIAVVAGWAFVGSCAVALHECLPPAPAVRR